MLWQIQRCGVRRFWGAETTPGLDRLAAARATQAVSCLQRLEPLQRLSQRVPVRSFSALPSPEERTSHSLLSRCLAHSQDPWTFKNVAKGPLPPILLLLGMAVWMNGNKGWDGTPKMNSVSIKIFGPNMPF
eukprot:g6499.t1